MKASIKHKNFSAVILSSKLLIGIDGGKFLV